jgi:hypothetical protein
MATLPWAAKRRTRNTSDEYCSFEKENEPRFFDQYSFHAEAADDYPIRNVLGVYNEMAERQPKIFALISRARAGNRCCIAGGRGPILRPGIGREIAGGDGKINTPLAAPLTRGDAPGRPMEELRKIFLSTRNFCARFVTPETMNFC